jgi:hypothetical protein
MGPDNIKAHIPRLQRDKVDIRVEVVYTLMEAYDRVGHGSLKVEGESVLLDVSTNNVQGTKRTPWTWPEEVAWRLEKVVQLLLEKGALRVCMCKFKPMSFMDVDPYCNTISDICLRMSDLGHRVHGVNTQTGISHLKRDGFHILLSFSVVLERTYACAITKVRVPCPNPPWDRYRDPTLRDRWLTSWEAQDQGSSHGRS